MSEMASAPAEATACAMPTISAALGVSLTITGSVVASLTALVTEAAEAGIGTEFHTARSHVGAAYIYFEPAHAGNLIQPAGQFGVFFQCLSGDIDDNRDFPSGPKGGFVADESVHAHVLQADGVEHAALRFGQARLFVALARKQAWCPCR